MKPASFAFAAFAVSVAVGGGMARAQTDATQAPAPVVRKVPAQTAAKTTTAGKATPTSTATKPATAGTATAGTATTGKVTSATTTTTAGKAATPKPAVARPTVAKPAAKAAPQPYVDSFPVVHMTAGQITPGPGKPMTLNKPAAVATKAPGTTSTVKAPVATTGVAAASGAVLPRQATTTAPKAATAGTAVTRPAAPKPALNAAGVAGMVAPKPTVVAKPVKAVDTAAAASVPTAMVPAGPVPGPMNRTVIVLDPAHGGADNGARLSDAILEKDVDLTFAFKLRSMLQARGFTVVLTRDSDSPMQGNDPGAQLTLDNRAGLANHARALACLLIHATGSGTGVHLYHSDLNPANGEAVNLPWLTAQAAWVTQSGALAQKMAQALTRGQVPLVSSGASVRPVDSLTCPALVVELAPKESGDASTINDADYQQTVAEAIAGALVFWKNQAQPPLKLVPVAPAASVATAVQP